MRSAADIEDKNEKHIVTPGRIVPARELLGQMLLELKRPAEALKEFEASQIREPNRFHGFAGAAQAAAQSGNSAQGQAELYPTRRTRWQRGTRDRNSSRQRCSWRSDEPRYWSVPALKWSRMISRRRAIVVLAAAIGLGTGSPCFSDPEETTPEVSAEDPDYVAGRKALEAKNWHLRYQIVFFRRRAQPP